MVGRENTGLFCHVWRFVWRYAFWSGETNTSVAMGVEGGCATACGVADKRGVTPPG